LLDYVHSRQRLAVLGFPHRILMRNNSRFAIVIGSALAVAAKVNRHRNQCRSYCASRPEFSLHRNLASTTRGVAG
jgi:hypothetical protein